MSSIEKLGIIGIRSYNPNAIAVVEFFKPLTLIWGHNGSGKTTIIEALKMATTGSLPPNTERGKTFLTDPQLMNQTEIQSQIKLRFKAINQKELLILRSFQVNFNKNQSQFKTIDSILKIRDKVTGEYVSINHTCVEMDRQVPALMGVSQSVLENIIFCHQEESLWPFSDNQTLKKIFDELFDTANFARTVENLKDKAKTYAKTMREILIKIEYTKKEINDFIRQAKQQAEYISQIGEEANRNNEQSNLLNQYNFDMQKIQDQMDLIKETSNQIYLKNVQLEQINQDLTEDISTINIEQIQKQYQDLENSIESNKNSLQQLSEEDKLYQTKIEELKQLIPHTEDFDVKEKEIIQEIQQILSTLEEKMKIESKSKFSNNVKQHYEKLKNQIQTDIETLNYQLALSNEKQNNFQTLLNNCVEKTQSYQQKLCFLDNVRGNNLQNLSGTKDEIEKLHSEIFQITQTIQSIPQVVYQTENVEEIKLSYEQKRKHIDYIYLENIKLNEVLGFLLEIEQKFYQIDKYLMVNQEHRKILEMEIQQKIKLTYQLPFQPENTKLIYTELKKTDDQLKNLQFQIEPLENDLLFHQKIIQQSKVQLKELENKFKASNQWEAFKQFKSNNQVNEILEVKAQLKAQKQNLIIEEFTAKTLFNSLIGKSEQTSQCVLCLQKIPPDCMKAMKEKHDKKQQNGVKFIKETQLHINELQQKKQKLSQSNEMFQEYITIEAKITQSEQFLQGINPEITQIKNKIITLAQQKQDITEGLELLESLREQEKKMKELVKEQEQLRYDQAQVNKQIEMKQLIINNQFIKRVEDIQLVKQMNHQNQIQLKQCQIELEQLAHLLQDNEMYEQIKTKNSQQKAFLIEKIQYKQNEIQAKVQLQVLQEEEIQHQQWEYEQISAEQQKEFQEIKQIKNEIQNMDNHCTQIQSNLNTLDLDLQLLDAQVGNKLKVLETVQQEILKDRPEYSEIKKLQDQLDQLLMEQEDIKTRINNIDIIVKSYTNQQQQIFKIIQQFQLYQQGQQIELEKQQKILLLQHQEKELNFLQMQYHQLLIGQQNNVNINQKINSDKEKCQQQNNLLFQRYENTQNEYSSLLVQQQITLMMMQECDFHQKVIEETLTKYHQDKMNEINKIIQDLWQEIYEGNDIDRILIQYEQDSKKAYHYKVVMECKGIKVEMKGRCSMGQKVLASIVIRLALAESFSLHCSILALDEPTTNLDRQHIARLAKQIIKIIHSRKQNENFQMIIITHDIELVSKLSGLATQYYEVSRANKFSEIKVKNISELK